MVERRRRGSTRREFVKGAVTLAFAHPMTGFAKSPTDHSANGRYRAYVGTYSGAAGSGSNGEGIYLFTMSTLSGELTHRKLVAVTTNPSWITIHPSKKYLYAVNEVDSFVGNSGSVSAFAIDASTGDLTALNVVSSQGRQPAHMSVDRSGKYAFVANYGGGRIAVLPILSDGSLGNAVDVHQNSGALESMQATNAPPGSFAVSGHDAPHAHMIAPDPGNKFVLATDLGQDRIYIYRFQGETGKLKAPENNAFVRLPSGDGPRHFAFHPNGHWFYTIQEESSTVAFFDYDGEHGKLTERQTISALPAGFAGTSFASEILISPDGRFLYAANRLHDAIAIFSIRADGHLKHLGESSTLGDYPNQCRIDPGGGFLYACNRKSDSITSFKIHSDTGLLTFTGQYAAVGSPSCITFLPMDR